MAQNKGNWRRPRREHWTGHPGIFSISHFKVLPWFFLTEWVLYIGESEGRVGRGWERVEAWTMGRDQIRSLPGHAGESEFHSAAHGVKDGCGGAEAGRLGPVENWGGPEPRWQEWRWRHGVELAVKQRGRPGCLRFQEERYMTGSSEGALRKSFSLCAPQGWCFLGRPSLHLLEIWTFNSAQTSQLKRRNFLIGGFPGKERTSWFSLFVYLNTLISKIYQLLSQIHLYLLIQIKRLERFL